MHLLGANGFEVHPLKSSAGKRIAIAATRDGLLYILDFLSETSKLEEDLYSARYRLSSLVSQMRNHNIRPNLTNILLVSCDVSPSQQRKLDEERNDVSLCRRKVISLEGAEKPGASDDLEQKLMPLLYSDSPTDFAEIQDPLTRLAARAKDERAIMLIEAFRKDRSSGLKRTIDSWVNSSA